MTRRRRFGRRPVHADERGPLLQVRRGEQLADRRERVLVVAVVPLAVSEGELERLRDHVDVARGVVAEGAQIEVREHAEGLHEDRSLCPGRLAEDFAAGERRPQRRLVARTVTRQIGGAQEPTDPLGEAADGGRDVAAVEALPRGSDAGQAMAPGLRVGLDEPPERHAQGWLHEQLTDLRYAAAWIEHRGTAGRIDVELTLRLRDGEQAMHVLVHREAVLGVLQGRRERLADGLRAARLEEREIGVDGTRHRERQVRLGPRTGRDPIEPAPAEECRRRQRRRGALPAQRERFSRPRVVNERHALAAERVRRRRLDHGRGEPGGRDSVERVAAREEHPHAGHRHQRVPARDDALGARHHGPCARPVRGVVLQFVNPSGRSAHRLTSTTSREILRQEPANNHSADPPAGRGLRPGDRSARAR